MLAGRFPGALASFTFGLLPGSVGTYSGGRATVFNPVDTLDGVGEGSAAIPDRFYLSASGGDFKALGGHSFGGILFVLDDYSHGTSIHDAGSRQTLRDQLGGTLNLQQFSTTLLRVSAEGKNGVAEAKVERLIKHSFPAFTITETGDKLRVQWARGKEVFLLEGMPSLTAPEWRVVGEAQGVNAEVVSVTIETTERSRFFRLRTE